MEISLKGKTLFITGAAGAIGSAICRKAAACGAGIAITDIAEEKGILLADEINGAGGNAYFTVANTADPKSTGEAVNRVLRHFGSIDILINNAGYNTSPSTRTTIDAMPESEWEKGIAVNLNGTYYVSKAIIGDMVRRRSGRIVNIASVVGQVPLRNQCAYAAAKAAIIGLTRAMAMELAEYNILVNAIAPGSIINAGLKEHFYSDKAHSDRMLANIPLKRPGDPEEIANVAVFASSDLISYMTGNIMTVDGGWICGDNLIEY